MTSYLAMFWIWLCSRWICMLGRWMWVFSSNGGTCIMLLNTRTVLALTLSKVLTLAVFLGFLFLCPWMYSSLLLPMCVERALPCVPFQSFDTFHPYNVVFSWFCAGSSRPKDNCQWKLQPTRTSPKTPPLCDQLVMILWSRHVEIVHVCMWMCMCYAWFLLLQGRPGMSDVSPLSGISGLSFDSTLLSPLLFFCLALLPYLIFFCLLVLSSELFPENSSIFFIKRDFFVWLLFRS